MALCMRINRADERAQFCVRAIAYRFQQKLGYIIMQWIRFFLCCCHSHRAPARKCESKCTRSKWAQDDQMTSPPSYTRPAMGQQLGFANTEILSIVGESMPSLTLGDSTSTPSERNWKESEHWKSNADRRLFQHLHVNQWEDIVLFSFALFCCFANLLREIITTLQINEILITV